MSPEIDPGVFVLEAVATGMAAFMDRFACGQDMVDAVGHRTQEAARLLADSVVSDLRAFWIKGDLPGTKHRIAAHAQSQLSAPIADAIANFVVPQNNYVH